MRGLEDSFTEEHGEGSKRRSSWCWSQKLSLRGVEFEVPFGCPRPDVQLELGLVGLELRRDGLACTNGGDMETSTAGRMS